MNDEGGIKCIDVMDKNILLTCAHMHNRMSFNKSLSFDGILPYIEMLCTMTWTGHGWIIEINYTQNKINIQSICEISVFCCPSGKVFTIQSQFLFIEQSRGLSFWN